MNFNLLFKYVYRVDLLSATDHASCNCQGTTFTTTSLNPAEIELLTLTQKRFRLVKWYGRDFGDRNEQ